MIDLKSESGSKGLDRTSSFRVCVATCGYHYVGIITTLYKGNALKGGRGTARSHFEPDDSDGAGWMEPDDWSRMEPDELDAGTG